jgi:hypothetical protein
LTTPPNFLQLLPKIKLFEISATIARSFVLPSQSMIHKQFLSRDGNATILPPLHCHRQKSIACVSVALIRLKQTVIAFIGQLLFKLKLPGIH